MRQLALLLLVVTAAAGCSSAPSRSQHAPLAVAHSEVAADSQLAAPSTATAGGPVVNQNLIKRGYRAMRRGDEIYYCHKDEITGSRFPQTVCRTEFQINDMERRAKYELHITPGACADKGCTD